MRDKRKFIVSEIGMYFLPHLLNLLYMLIIANANPDLKHWERDDYVSGWLFLATLAIFYIFILKKHFSHYKKIGLGSIYGAITQVMNIAIHVAAMRYYYNEALWDSIYIDLILFYFTGLPILFIIIAIVYFKRKKKSGE